jgi:DNA-binding response OmpR family regulator
MAGKILVVDDERSITIPLRFMLEAAGYTVADAESGEAAIDTILTWRPDLMVLDVTLPAMDGFELCRIVRGNTECRHLKIVLLTALTRESVIAKGYSLGANAILTKPFSNRELLETVKSLLNAGG